ncbi:MAG TPA: hypothetical protein ENJ15_06950 [Caldithrix abyssi]|uniref:Uncharacterized protein n=1 Tax=Caldithrix abyssi TaxID=187145 RepID=A0A7V5VF50_CALAY|nr:hypothetical protein [Caldithrix abyssi]
MAVLIEAISVVVRERAIAEKMKGGLPLFLRERPNLTHCADGQLHRLGFMTPHEVHDYVNFLMENGLEFVRGGKCRDFVVVDMLNGPTMPCDWIEVSRSAFFRGMTEFKNREQKFTFAWLRPKGPDETPNLTLTAPEGWSPDLALHAHNFIPFSKDGQERN